MQNKMFRAALLQLRNSGLFCDLTLIAGNDGSRHQVHRCVLYAASDYFKLMFTAKTKEKDAKEIVLQHIDGDILSQLIDYCYTLEISLTEDNVEAILVAAHLFELTHVVQMCFEFYRKNLTVSNALSCLIMAGTYDKDDLREVAEKYVCRKFILIVEDPSFHQMTAENLSVLLSWNDIIINSEEDVFNAAVKWINANRNEREKYFPMLMKAVRFSLINKKVC